MYTKKRKKEKKKKDEERGTTKLMEAVKNLPHYEHALMLIIIPLVQFQVSKFLCLVSN